MIDVFKMKPIFDAKFHAIRRRRRKGKIENRKTGK